MKQVFVVSSWLQLLNISAAIRNNRIDSAEERVLFVSDTRAVCEVGTSFAEEEISEPLLDVFDRIVDYNAWIWPHHPAQWTPRINEQPMWRKSLLHAWDLADCHVQLFVESLQGNPAQALCSLFPDAEVFAHADGLMTYGPTRSTLPPQVWQRLGGLVYMDLVPDVEPLLLSEEQGIERTAITADELRAEIERVAAHVDTSGLSVSDNTCMIIGQYLADVALFTLEQETAVYEQMIDHAIATGHEHIYLKPHPSASQSVQSALEHRAAQRGISFDVVPAHLPVEISALALKPRSVYSCFSTGMVTAWRLFGIPATAFGTLEALEEFRPYENSNRIPVTICDYLFAPGASHTVPLSAVIDAVGYCMQAKQMSRLRQHAVAFLSAHYAEYSRYFKRRRLTKLDLPGRLPPRRPASRARQLGVRAVRAGSVIVSEGRRFGASALTQLKAARSSASERSKK
ncbi:alpha-2,8-polysialyltransferase family protein [Brevibacterium gallinarum]|uniref:alpha-2,8-polysialyltransferase family protein n=1 Tax=Brevibacterium gallinarum TaxID=2762220 RepID=UPI001CD90446|nr:alpha-2,8-polysialyltransferase family protein [Brevibacterium gallinarum]